MQEDRLFDYLLVLDFEATCEDNVQMEPCAEIIEFPVRVIKLGDNKFLEDVFHYYVKPKYNQKLTEFCTKLTGITQEIVDKGENLEDVIKKFDQWVEKYENWIFVTCGNWDLNTCLKNEAWVKGIEIKSYFRKFLNIKELFPEPPGWKKKGKFRARGMTDMLDWLDLDLEGRHHSGIDDTLNIGRVVIELLNKETLKIKKQNIHHVNPPVKPN